MRSNLSLVENGSVYPQARVMLLHQQHTEAGLEQAKAIASLFGSKKAALQPVSSCCREASV